MQKRITILFVLFSLALISPKLTRAEVPIAEASAELNEISTPPDFDYRVEVLERFLSENQSPLTPYAKELVENADEYHLDWRFVTAIAGVESTFGRRMPSSSYNAYGWANGVYRFNSWEDSIETVSKTLREKYKDEGAFSIEQIGRKYAPPSKTWAQKVRFYMRKIDPVPLTFSLEG
jgi:hypothetical protein